MRQAIEEGFILDVLKGYLPYKTAFNLAEPAKDGKRVDSKAAKRALAKWLTLHATNVTPEGRVHRRALCRQRGTAFGRYGKGHDRDPRRVPRLFGTNAALTRTSRRIPNTARFRPLWPFPVR